MSFDPFQNQEEHEDQENKNDSPSAAALLEEALQKHPRSKFGAPMIGAILFGEINKLSLDSELTIAESLYIFKPVVRLRSYFKGQDLFEASYYWDEVCCFG